MPSGPVSWETLTWLATVLIGAISGASTVLGLGWRLYGTLLQRITAADERAKAAEAALRSDLAATLTHVAENYATKSGTTSAVERVEGAVDRLTGQVEAAVDRLSGRIDRLLEAQATPAATRRRPAE